MGEHNSAFLRFEIERIRGNISGIDIQINYGLQKVRELRRQGNASAEYHWHTELFKCRELRAKEERKLRQMEERRLL